MSDSIKITLPPEAEQRIQAAVDYHKQGYSCSQSVVMAFADLYGVEPKLACRMSTGFGGGVGRMRMMCGAVSAVVMLCGLDKDTEGSSNAKMPCYELVRDRVEAFRSRQGSIICAELLKDKIPCDAKVECAARVFAEYYYTKM